MNSNRNIPIPPLFLEKFEKLISSKEFPAFSASLDGQPVSGLRVNTLKTSLEKFVEQSPFQLGEKVPWCDNAYYLSGSDRPGQHPYHAAGVYYLQDPSAMVPAQILSPLPTDRVLDLSAAPGGKTTQLAALMGGNGLLVANEIKDKRIGHLIQNVERWGAGNVLITNETPERLADTFGPYFDRVLVDAPCSGEGMFRKDQGARAEWSQDMVEGCAVRQKNIMKIAAKCVRPGGHLLYSTCTFSPEEDEGVIAEVLKTYPEMEVVDIFSVAGFDQGKPEWIGVDPSISKAIRLFPHKIVGEGHFACLMRKKDGKEQKKGKDQWRKPLAKADLLSWRAFCQDVLALEIDEERLKVVGERLYYQPEEVPETGTLRVAHHGVWFGNLKKDRFEPSHPLALFLPAKAFKNTHPLDSTSPHISSYIQGGILETTSKGWTVITVDGFPIGWGKGVQGSLKNHYPKGWMK